MTTVTELREMLQEMEEVGQGSADVLFAYNYGDYWRTQVAAPIVRCEEGSVVHSEYHNMDKTVDADEDDSLPAYRAVRRVVLLS